MGKQNFQCKNRIHLLLLSGLLMVGFLLSGIAFGAAPQNSPRLAKPVTSDESQALMDERSIAKVLSRDNVLRSKIEHTKTRDRDLAIAGWKVTSFGGISFTPSDDRYWVKINGAMRYDETSFFTNNQVFRGNPFVGNLQLPKASGHLRKLGIGIDGGIGQDLEYTVGVEFGQRTNGAGVNLSDTWLAYDGFCPEHNEVFIGPLMPGYYYGIDNADNTSWLPFLERSLIADAFYPGDGYGVMTDFFGEHFGLTLVASSGDIGNVTLDARRHDNRMRGIARLTVSPVHEVGDVWHFGVSAQARSKDTDLISGFSARPSARTRQPSPRFVNTGPINSKDAFGYSVEFARLCGPFLLEAEYQSMHVNRLNRARALQFYGWLVQARYLITGGSHSYDVRDGGFGSIRAEDFTPCGAWEVTARYDMINLNSREIFGGRQYDASVGLHWYINELVKFSANYIHATVYPDRGNRRRQDVNIFGLRLQVRFR